MLKLNRLSAMMGIALSAAALGAACQDDSALAGPGSAQDAQTAQVSDDGSAAARGGAAGRANEAARREYEVTIENLTTSQPFSPGVIVTHTNKASVFEVGQRSSPLIVKISEDGFPPADVIEDVLGGVDGIDEIFQFHQPMMPIGANLPGGLQGPPTSDTFVIGATANANRLSIATMIICTNDGFTGLSGVRLPGGFKAATYFADAYDSGGEVNTEEYADIVDGCTLAGPVRRAPDGNIDDLPEDGRIIRHHTGITGVAGEDGLSPELHNWDNPVAKITVRRIK